MTTEQKAKAYDEALERAKKLQETCDSTAVVGWCEYIFPELKELDGERTRKAILTGLMDCRDAPDLGWSDFGGINIDECIAWIEKQREQTHVEHGQPEVTKTSDPELEPKFKVRDWVVYDHRPYQVVELPKEGYINLGLRRNGKVEFAPSPYCRHWTIQDAKDGDILATWAGAFIYNGNNDGIGCPGSYCGINTLGRFQIGGEKHWTGKKVYPATKEQRDLLFQKMKEAGYEWNAVTKELKRITKFKNGDKVHCGDESQPVTIIDITNDSYITDSMIGPILFSEEDNWTLIEQKPVDNVEPKFKADNYIVLDDITSSEIWRVINIDKDGYYNIQCITNPEYDEIYRVPGFILEKDYRLWTIEDAKDGDALVDEDNNIGLYQEEKDDLYWHSYIYIGCDNCLRGFGGYHEYENTKPATKELRDLLFQKMKESGYEWDGEKKELKKIEHKFNVDDWIVTDDSFGKIVRHVDEISFNIIDKGYVLSDENGLIYDISFDNEHKWHKWTIHDAEDGDVLASELTSFIFLFRGIKGNKIDFYCDYDTSLEWPETWSDDRFAINDTNQHYGRVEKSQDVHPATKEQRETLIKAMANAGYTFDFEKKELKKIKPKKLDPDKVIAWLNDQACQGWIEDVEVDKFVAKFKQDFGL